MPGLRERVIDIICKEWPNPENKVLSATIHERLKSAGAEASDHDVQEVLKHLADHDDITLVFEPGRETKPIVAGVRRGLCT
jgi:hypothetical protein